MKLDNLIEKFLKDSKIRKNENTYIFELMHLAVIRRFFEINEIEYVYEFDEDEIYSFIEYLKELGNCNSTINKKISLLKRIFKFNKIDDHVLYNFKKMKEDVRHYNNFSENQLRAIINYFDDNDYYASRPLVKLNDECIIRLLYDTGIRRNELLHVEVKNIDFDRKLLLLDVNKTGVYSVVPFTNSTADMIKKLISNIPGQEYLFYNFRNNQVMNKYYLRHFFEKMQNDLGFKIHPHMFRHTLATKLIENECPLVVVQKILRHSSIKTTQIYEHMVQKKTVELYNKYLPTL